MTERLRDALVAAVNGNPISADLAWELIHEWDARVRALTEIAYLDEQSEAYHADDVALRIARDALSDAPTDRCQICGRERPARAISIAGGVRYCNDDHNDLKCHEKVARCTYDRAGCVRPVAKKRYEKRPFVCRCGREHFAVRDSSNWAGNGWEWQHPR